MRPFECADTRLTDVGAFHRDMHNRIFVETIATKDHIGIYIPQIHRICSLMNNLIFNSNERTFACDCL